jgi:hypothetical protein
MSVDPIAAALAVIAIALAIILYRLSRERKELTYSYVSLTSLLPEPVQAEGLELRYRGEIVRHPYILLMRISNTGNQPIASSDYESPITVELKPSTILSVEITRTNPEDMDAQVGRKSGSLVIEPTLLNPGDWLALKVILDNFPSSRVVRVESSEYELFASTVVQDGEVGRLFEPSHWALQPRRVPHQRLLQGCNM